VPDLVQNNLSSPLVCAMPDNFLKSHVGSPDGLSDYQSEPASSTAPRSKIIQIVERSEFIRGCLSFWLRESCPEYEIMAIPDIKRSVDERYASRIAAVVVGTDTFQATRRWDVHEVSSFRQRLSKVPVVAIVTAEMVSEIEDWVHRFALSGYILTSSSMDVASAALRLVIAGGTYFPRNEPNGQSNGQASPGITNGLSRNYAATKLTLRERAVFERLGHGTPNKIIAHELNMSLSTVKAHVHSIIQKLKVKNRTEVAVAAQTSQFGILSGIEGR
jgi:DNA-binding NarL/FixJ family response regulator